MLLTVRKQLNVYDNDISTVIDKYLEYIALKEKEYQTVFRGTESDHRKVGKKEMVEFISKKLGDLEISEAWRRINKDDLLGSYDFNSLYPGAEADKNSKGPAIETAFPFKNYMNDAVCESFNSGR